MANLPKTNENYDVRDYDDLQTETINENKIKQGGEYTKIISILPASGTSKNIAIGWEHSDAHIMSYRVQNTNNAWLSGVGESSVIAGDWGIKVRLIGQTMTIWNGLAGLNGKTIEVIIKNNVFETKEF